MVGAERGHLVSHLCCRRPTVYRGADVGTGELVRWRRSWWRMAPGRRAGRGRRCARCCAARATSCGRRPIRGSASARISPMPRSASTRISATSSRCSRCEDLNDVILIGHSYGGMVATGVADRARARISQLVYLDAFAPIDGQAMFDLVPPDIAEKMRAGAAAKPERLRHSAQPDAVRHGAGGRRLGDAAPAAAAAQGVLHEAEAVAPSPRRRAATSTAPRPASATPSASSPSARKREGWRYFRDRREPQSAHHQSDGAARRSCSEIADT